MQIRLPRQWLAATIVTVLATQMLTGQNPSPMFTGVSKVWTNGGVSALTGIPGFQVTPIISGDNDTKLPGLFAATASLGSGHALAVGHGGFLGDTANAAFDTLRFNTQAFAWLDKNNTLAVGVLSGHREWKKLGGMSMLAAALRTKGYQVRDVSGSVTSAKLNGVGVIVVGNAWADFTSTELTLLEAHVRAGGGLYMAGVGWSWPAYNSPKNLDQYPMNILARRFGLTWIGPGISDPTNNQQGSPIFHTFYPSCSLYLPLAGLNHLKAITSSHPTSLDSFLRGSVNERTKFLISVAQVAIALGQLPEVGGIRAAWDQSARAFMQAQKRWFGMARKFSKSSDPALAIARAVMHANTVAAFPLTPSRMTDIKTAIDMTAAHADYTEIFDKYKILVLDNRSLDAKQRASIKDVLHLTAGVPKPMHRITVKGFWGTASPDLRSSMSGAGVNIFSVGMTSTENGFPKDVTPLRRPTFTIALAHEVAHSIDAEAKKTGSYKSRLDKLIRDAGIDDQQYLRSMVGGAFFQKAPQEFTASIANQWMIDSVHTMRVAVTRQRAGKLEPLLQALFMLDLYGQYQATAPLFRTDNQGRVTAKVAYVSRDGYGRIYAVRSSDLSIRVIYDATGKPSKVSSTLAYAEESPVLGVTFGTTSGPYLGNPVFAFEGRTPTANSSGFMILGSKAANLALPAPVFSGRLHVEPSTAIVLGITSNLQAGIYVQAPIPNNASLVNVRLFAQAMMQRPNPNGPDLVGVSRGLELWIGAQ